MDPFDDNFDLEMELEQLDQLENEIEIRMDMEQLGAINFVGGVQRAFIRPQANINDPHMPAPNLPAAGDIPREPPNNPQAEQQDEQVVDGNASIKTEADFNCIGNEDYDDVILTPKGAEMKGFSCSICYDSFNTERRLPKVFPCGHTFCLSCVGGLSKNRNFLSSSTIICPTCRQNTRYSMSTIAEKIPTNFCILSMLEQRKEEKKQQNEPEMLSCNECSKHFMGTEVTVCNDDTCQKNSAEDQPEFDNIKRSKHQLVCRVCINANHSRHNFIPFEKVVAQYEANQKIIIAEAALVKVLKAADDGILTIDQTKAELLRHRQRIVNALENIRNEANHPQIYEYLSRFMVSVKASADLFKGLIDDLNKFDGSSKARYYRTFGNDILRPISFIRVKNDGSIVPKKEEEEDEANQNQRNRPQQAENRAQNRLARFNVFGPFPAHDILVRPGGRENGIPLQAADQAPHIENMIEQVLQQLEGNVPRLRENQPAAAGDAAGLAAPHDPRDGLGFRNPRLNMWAVRALPRRFRRNENHARNLRVVRNNLQAAMEEHVVLHGFPAIHQAIEDLRDVIWNLEGPFARRNELVNDIAFGREIEQAEEQLNLLRERLGRLEAAHEERQAAILQEPEEEIAVPGPWVDEVVEDPLPPLPPIEGVDQEIIQRAEIGELVNRIMGMVRNEAHAEAAVNGVRVPDRIEMPPLLNPGAVPGVPDYNHLMPVQVAPFLRDLRALELEWIQRGRDRRARAVPQPPRENAENPAEVIQEPAERQEVAQADPEQIQLNQVEQENRVERDDPNPNVSPIPDEPAAKRLRQ